jgi:Tfp pilus assembly protein PilO
MQMPRFDKAATFLNSRNTREKYMLIAFIGVFIFTLDYFVWLSPVIRMFGEAAPKIAPLREELKALRDDEKNKDAIRQKWQDAQKELSEKDRQFISPDETPALLENLSKLAQKAGVRLTALEPSDAPKTKKGLYAPFPIQVKATASTHELGTFLSNLESGTTFFRIKDLRIANNPLNERKHVVEMAMEAYRRER